jgi:hypothetical protein
VDTKNRSASILQFDNLRSATFVHDDGENAPAVILSISEESPRSEGSLSPHFVDTQKTRGGK